MEVNVAAILKSGDCSKNLILSWGDLVEIPETDHPVAEQWSGFSREALRTLKNCMTRMITFFVKDQTVPFSFSPAISFEEGKRGFVSNRPFGLLPVLAESKPLRTSSDLLRMKVRRRDAIGGQVHEWSMDRNETSDLWLRDGDVIKVPDKP